MRSGREPSQFNAIFRNSSGSRHDEAENLGENKVESVEGLMNLWGKLPLYAIDAQVVGS